MDYIHDVLEEVSYIRPRDPNISRNAKYNLKPVRMNIKFSLNEQSESSTSNAENKNSIEEDRVQIYLRVKPSTSNNSIEDYIIHEKELIYKSSEQDVKNTKDRETIYKKLIFSDIFRKATKQVDIFNDIVKIKVFEFINGKDTALFTCGTTGSGRTFTTIGTAEEPGLLVRALEYIFKTLPEFPEIPSVKPTPDGRVIKLAPNQARSELALKAGIWKSQRAADRLGNIKLYQEMQETLRNEPYAVLDQLAEVSIGVWVSFVEIHNDSMLDLLQSPVNSGNKRLRIGVSNGKPYISDLTHICVSNGLEAFQVYQYGMQKLKSTRANSIFTIKIAHSLLNRETKFISAFSICNLANSIDNSVIVLGKCIAAPKNPQEFSNQKNYIPYRDSKLTQLFHRTCLGLQDFTLIININLSREKLRETQNIVNIPLLSKEIISKTAVSKYIALRMEYFVELDQNIKELKQAIHERKTDYEDLVEMKSSNYELEKRTLIKGYEEVLRDANELFNMKKRNLKEKYQEMYEMESHEIKMKFKKKFDQRNKRKTKEEVKKLKEAYESKEIKIQNLGSRISDLQCKLNEITNLALSIEKNNKVIANLEESFEKHEMDSFISNEIQCEGNIESSFNNNKLVASLEEFIEPNKKGSLISNEIQFEGNNEKSLGETSISDKNNKPFADSEKSIEDSSISNEEDIDRSLEEASSISYHKKLILDSGKSIEDSLILDKIQCEENIDRTSKNASSIDNIKFIADSEESFGDSLISDEIESEEDIGRSLGKSSTFDNNKLIADSEKSIEDSLISNDIQCEEDIDRSLKEASSMVNNTKLIVDSEKSLKDLLIFNESQPEEFLDRSLENASSINNSKDISNSGKSVENSLISNEIQCKEDIDGSFKKGSNIVLNKLVIDSEKSIEDSLSTYENQGEENIDRSLKTASSIDNDHKLIADSEKSIEDSLISDEGNIECC